MLLTLPCPGALPLPFLFSLAGIARKPPGLRTYNKSPARCRAGRAKQHYPAKNVNPFPPRRSPGRTLPGQEGVKGDTCLSPSPFSLPFGKKRKNLRSSMRRSLNTHRTPHLLSAYPKFSFLSQPLLLLLRCLVLLFLPSIPLKAMRLILTAKHFPA